MKVRGTLFCGMFCITAHAADCPTPLLCPTTAACATDPRQTAKPFDPNTEAPRVSAGVTEQKPNGDIKLSGKVEIRQGERVLKAEEIQYFKENDDFNIPGA